jgi:hypothetical protein
MGSNSSCKETLFTEIFRYFTRYCPIYRDNSCAIFRSVLVWNILPTRCRCTGFLLHLITLIDTHTHTHTHTHSIWVHWTTDRPDAETSTGNTQHSEQTSMFPAGFESAIPSSEWPQTHALDRAASGTSLMFLSYHLSPFFSRNHRVLFNPRYKQPCYLHQVRRTYCRAN